MSHADRIRESSSGALVGKNIAGIGAIGKSQTNILKDNDRINLAKINMINEKKQDEVPRNT